MSYCRFSSDDFRCDVYCYESVGGGFPIHVAAKRHVFREPLPAPVDIRKDPKGWRDRYEIVTAMVNGADLVPIGGPHDGAHFDEPTARDALARLEELRDAGYNVPESAIAALREDAEREDTP